MLPAFPLSPVALDQTVSAALAEDLGLAGDLTSSLAVSEETWASAHCIARKSGVISGLELAVRVFALAGEGVTTNSLVKDGDMVVPGTPVLSVSGPARGVLAGERTALNFLGHLSGVASETFKLVEAISHTSARICCTRKTTPGLRALEKYAVRCGGGFNHRFSLSDGVLIKDNHIFAAEGVASAVSKARMLAGHMVKIEVEVDQIDQIEPALAAGADAIMLDNMDLPTMIEAVELIASRSIVEASGSITIDSIVEVAETGVDIISVGWITHSAASLDLGLDFLD